MSRHALTLAPVLMLLTAAGCGPNLCERAESAAAGKQGSCSAVLALPGSTCSTGLSACSDADRKALEAWVDCLGALPACAPFTESAWVTQRDACHGLLSGVGTACGEGLFGGALPGRPDGGPAEVTRSPDADGRGALDLVAVTDGTTVALAWAATQPGTVAGWEVHSVEGDGVSLPLEAVSAPGQRTLTVTGLPTGSTRRYWVVGVDAAGNVALGQPPQPTGAGDAGVGCAGPNDCANELVCDLGTCRFFPCSGGGTTTCPSGYACEPNLGGCVRSSALGGAGPGVTPAGPGTGESRPFVSELRAVAGGDGGFGERVVSDFAPDGDPVLAALDSARQVVVVQQGGQLFSHATQDRGATWAVATLDAIGQRAQLAWNRESGRLFACYQVGTYVRVRVSSTDGRSWDPGAAEVSLSGATVKDCDIAPWTGGGALLVTAEPDGLFLREVGVDLALSDKKVVYANEAPAGGGSTVFAAERPSVDTDPVKPLVHVVFTGSRNLLAGGTDKDVHGVYREGTVTQFSARKRLTLGSLGSQGQNLLQDNAQVAVEPGTGRALAVFQSEEPGVSGATPFTTAYVAMFGLNPQAPDWASGSDLSVFAKDAVGNYLVVPDRPAVGAVWDAVSPGIAFQPAGRATVVFSAGPQGQPRHPYAVGFSFDAVSQVGAAAGKGWFTGAAVRLSQAAVVDFGNSPRRAGPVLAADGQLSTYAGFIEGVGAGATFANRLLVYARP